MEITYENDRVLEYLKERDRKRRTLWQFAAVVAVLGAPLTYLIVDKVTSNVEVTEQQGEP